MTQPTAYSREYNFTDYQAANPTTPLPGSHVDAELNRVKAVLDQIEGNLALIQRDDTALANASVGLDQLSPTVTVGFNVATAWVTAKAYTTADFVFNGQIYYHCLLAHTSGTFATDLAAGKWLQLVDFSALVAASTSVPGIIQIASDAEALAKAVTNHALVPSNLGALGSTTSFAGLIQLASDAEAIAAAANNRALTPSNLAALTATNLAALKASNAQTAAMASSAVFVTPSNLAVLANTSFRNVARANGGLEVWQRGAGGSASMAVGASTTAYTADRWYLTTGANQASVVDQIAGIADGSQFAARVRRNSGQTGTTAMKFGFPLDSDEVFALRNGIAALSFTVKAGANWSPTSGTLSYALAVGTGAVAKRGAGFTAETTPISSSINLTAGGAAQRVTAVAAGVTAATSTQGEIQFTWTPTGTAGAADDFTIDDLQLEIVPSASSAATTFERTKFEECLLMCQRHFWKSFPYNTAPAQNGGVTGCLWAIAGRAGALVEYIPFRFPVVMRSNPPATLTPYNPAAANAQARDGGAAVDCSATGVSSTGDVGCVVLTTGNASTAVGNPIQIHVTADAGI